jgi:hypothetical protein
MNGIVDLSDRVSFLNFSWEEILGSAGQATIELEFLDETVFIERLADLRIYKGSFNLFRGRCLELEMERVGTAARAHLTVEDWNGLIDQIPVGAPDGFSFVTQDDGTDLAVDPLALNSGGNHYMHDYWPLPGLPPGVDFDTFYDLTLSPPTLPVRLDRYTALTTLRSVMDDDAAHVSGAVRYWLDPDLAFHWVELPPSDIIFGNGTDSLIMTRAQQAAQQYAMLWPAFDVTSLSTAPYILGDTLDKAGGITMPMRMSLKWDWRQMRERLYIRGSTVPGSGYVIADDAGMSPSVAGGREYIDAPGSLYADDKQAIGIWNFRQNFRELLTGSASISPGFDGWRVGQSLVVSDAVLSQLFDHDISNRVLTIQSVRGMLKVPAQDSDDPDAGDIIYDLAFGDIPRGSLARQLAQIPEPDPPAVIYHFIVTVDDPNMPDGGSSPVKAQLADAGNAPVRMGGVPLEWVQPIFQFEDNAETTPGTVYTLADDTGTTDAAGTVFSTITRSGTPTAEYHWHVEAVALPVS